MAATLDSAWAPFVRAPTHAAVIVDFDGSLAPIVGDPAEAEPLPEAVQACSRLAARLAVVAVVTGRPVDFVRSHVRDPAIVVIGQYGLEHEVDGVVVSDPRAAPFEAAVAAAARDAVRAWPGCSVERKGTVAFTVHWRGAPDAAPTPSALADLADRWDLVPIAGRMACELRPPIAVDKGTAVAEVLARRDLAAAAFAGDDHGDLPAFAALRAWSTVDPERVAVRVAVASEESPDELLVAADLRLDGPLALADQLVALARAVEGGSAG